MDRGSTPLRSTGGEGMLTEEQEKDLDEMAKRFAETKDGS